MPEPEVRPPDFAAWQHDTLVQFATEALDKLQKNGRTLVWFGLNWSLDLYDQFNARLRRQGQGAPVICHRIMCRDTLDQAQAIALNEKATTQSALRGAVKQYREQKGV